MKYEIDGKWYEAPPGYVMESMFFNPRREDNPYLLRAGDKVLVKGRMGTNWAIITEDDMAVGKPFTEVLKQYTDIQLLAIPQKYRFSEDSVHSLHGYFDWSATGMGHGQMSFALNRGTGMVEFDTEMMGPESTRRILHDFVDFIVDNGHSDDWDDIESRNVD